MKKEIIYVDEVFQEGGGQIKTYEKAIYLLERVFKEQYESFTNILIEDRQIEFILPVGKYICTFTMATRTGYTSVFFLEKMTDAEAVVLSLRYYHTRQQFLLAHELLKQQGFVGDKEIVLIEGEILNLGNN